MYPQGYTCRSYTDIFINMQTISQYIPFSQHRINYVKQRVSKDKNDITAWSCFAFAVIYFFHFQSDKDFSFLLVLVSFMDFKQTLSSIVQTFGFILVLFKTAKCRSVEGTLFICSQLGISLKSLVFYLVVSISRFISVIFSDAYLPYDRSGDWLYRITEGLGLLSIIALLLLTRKHHFTYYSYIVKVCSYWSIGFVCRNRLKGMEVDYYHYSSIIHLCRSRLF